ncbi:MAG: amidohydrolase family protein [Xanthobacteraceae bacterium]|uniref:amidohydrolase family protein n=1 Tax=Pseudolabrys sp. TaxID=1960880 RepID=UPI003D10E3CA
MITDIHRHFVPRQFFDFMVSRPEFAIRIKRREGELIDTDIRGIHFGLNETFFDLPRQLDSMKAEGVERAILSLATPFIDYHLDAKLAVESARRFNEALAISLAGKDRQFGAWAFLPMQDPAAAAAELKRCVTDYGFVGGHVASNVRGTYLSDTSFEPIYRVATELDVPLFVHPADPAGKERMRDYELTVVAGYLFDNTINILRMVCSGFLDRWPKLKLVCAHAGAFSMILRARMQREVDTNAQLSATLKAPVGDYLRRLYFDSICFEPDILRYAVSVVPVEHVLMGSDAPFPLGEPHPVSFVRSALPVAQADAILTKNAARLFGR